MKSSFRIVASSFLLLLVAAAALPFVLPLREGKPLLDWRKLTLPAPPLPTLGAPDAGPVSVYRWQDAQGQWQFSNEPPPEGMSYELQIIDPDANLMARLPQQVPGSRPPVTEPTAAPLAGVAGALETLEGARNVQRLVDEHYRVQGEQTGIR